MILKDTKLRNKLQKITKEDQQIKDIILFGSAARSKEYPNDIDILVIFNKKINKDKEYNIRKEIEKEYKNIAIISKTEEGIRDPTFDARESLLFEGISLLNQKNLAKEYGYIQVGLFKYETRKWTNVQKTKFYYALNGRKGNKGILQETQSIRLADNIITTSLKQIDQMKKFFDSWNIRYIYIPTLIPERMNNEKILKN